MKREEKNQQTKRRIMDAALAEFSTQGYAAGSTNTICAAQGFSIPIRSIRVFLAKLYSHRPSICEMRYRNADCALTVSTFKF